MGLLAATTSGVLKIKKEKNGEEPKKGDQIQFQLNAKQVQHELMHSVLFKRALQLFGLIE